MHQSPLFLHGRPAARTGSQVLLDLPSLG